MPDVAMPDKNQTLHLPLLLFPLLPHRCCRHQHPVLDLLHFAVAQARIRPQPGSQDKVLCCCLPTLFLPLLPYLPGHGHCHGQWGTRSRLGRGLHALHPPSRRRLRPPAAPWHLPHPLCLPGQPFGGSKVGLARGSHKLVVSLPKVALRVAFPRRRSYQHCCCRCRHRCCYRRLAKVWKRTQRERTQRHCSPPLARGSISSRSLSSSLRTRAQTAGCVCGG